MLRHEKSLGTLTPFNSLPSTVITSCYYNKHNMLVNRYCTPAELLVQYTPKFAGVIVKYKGRFEEDEDKDEVASRLKKEVGDRAFNVVACEFTTFYENEISYEFHVSTLGMYARHIATAIKRANLDIEEMGGIEPNH